MATGNRHIRGYSNVFRVLIWLVVIAYLGQAVLAGQFLSGTYAALRLHQTGGTASDLILFLAVVIGALLRWHAKGSLWPFWVALGLLVANQVQNGAGAARLISLHIPLGVAMLAIALVAALAASRGNRLADSESTIESRPEIKALRTSAWEPKA